MKNKFNCWLWLLVASFFLNSEPGEAKVKDLELSAKLGLNLSQPISLPENYFTNSELAYIPGYYISGMVHYRYKIVSIGTGLGLKSIRFNYCFKYDYEDIVRLNYYFFPLEFKANLTKANPFFITCSAEFSTLFNDVNHEIQKLHLYEQYQLELYKWYQEKTNWYFFGIGKQFNPKTSMVIEIGYSGYVQNPPDSLPENSTALGYFAYHKKRILEFRVAISKIININ